MENKMSTSTPQKHKYPVMKLVLDMIVIAAIAALYAENVSTLMYYEVAGLAVFGCILVHLILNGSWITNVVEHAFTGNLKGKALAIVIVDFLLIFAGIAVLDTGILSSKVIYALPVEGLLSWHYVSVAFALILTGVRLGLHRADLDADRRNVCQEIL